MNKIKRAKILNSKEFKCKIICNKNCFVSKFYLRNRVFNYNILIIINNNILLQYNNITLYYYIIVTLNNYYINNAVE